MTGMKCLAMYLDLMNKYAEFNGVYGFRIENLLNHNPVILTIIEKNPDGSISEPYDLICNTEDGDLHIMNTNGDDCLKMQKEADNLSDEEMEKQKLAYREIIKKYMD